MNEQQRAMLTEFAAGSQILQEFLAIVPPELIDRQAADGGWCAHQILAHVADAELILAIRFRQFLAEDEAKLLPFQPDVWAAALNYRALPYDEIIAMASNVRRSSASLVAGAGDHIWQRTAIHPSRGTFYLVDLLQMGIDHLRDHGVQLRALATSHA